jgi:uracil phosphoribosyltransferase
MTSDLSTHPLVQHYLTILRDRSTQASEFRRCSKRITEVIIVEAAKQLSLDLIQVQTPLEIADGARLSPGVVFGYIGMERDEATAEAKCYYAKMPDFSSSTQVFVLDPMLATGGSAAQCVEQIKAKGAKNVNMVCIIAAPEGIAAFEEAHPDVNILAGKIDRELNDQKYILPGLGDFGDRLFNT